MNTKSIFITLLLASVSVFGAGPTDEQVKEIIKQTKMHLADVLKDPSSYKEGDWTIWIGTNKDGDTLVRCLHEYSALNGFGGRSSEIILGSSPNPLVKSWLFTNLKNYRVGNMDLGAEIYKNMKKELSLISEKDVVVIKATRILGQEILK